MKNNTYDIIIVGGGIVGSMIAVALAELTPLSIAILEAKSTLDKWDEHTYHHRVSAISLSSIRLLQQLGPWQSILKKRASPFTKIKVWESISGQELQFDCQAIAEPILGHIIENNLMLEALREKISTLPNIAVVAPVHLLEFRQNANEVIFIDDKQEVYRARLAIAADGANSWLRQQTQINVQQKNYEQDAIVATVSTALPHKRTAYQTFLPTGPLAFLPLAEENSSSIVWTLPTTETERLKNLPKEVFLQELTKAFSFHLGEVRDVAKLFSFPLYEQKAAHYIAPRVALVGDAAHTVHPLAGQGLNMGLLDAASLAEIISEAFHTKRDYGSHYILRRYERWRRADNFLMQQGVDSLQKLFCKEQRALFYLRSLGLKFVNQAAWLNKFFMQQAVGNRLGLPKLAQKI